MYRDHPPLAHDRPELTQTGLAVEWTNREFHGDCIGSGRENFSDQIPLHSLSQHPIQ